jgi:16S rRNA (cytosine1402-N4)-methyltransferase
VVVAGHISVLYQEVLAGLALRPSGHYIDCTVGSGGHAAGILEGSAPSGRVLALDADVEAVARAAAALARFGDRVVFEHCNFRALGQVAARHGWDQVDGIVFDLGVSSVQLGTPERGFSFQASGALDMRMDQEGALSAMEIVNTWPETALVRVLRDFGEEPRAARIASAIIAARAQQPILTTAHLRDVVLRVKGRRGHLHPATTVFQALRIAVNEELESLRLALPQAVTLLQPGGRLVVIAFHSLEDRIVKHFLQDEARICRCPPGQPVCTCAQRPRLRLVTRHAQQASAQERARNPRARSARLRIAERL